MIKEVLGENIRMLRVERRMTQEMLASLCGTSRQVVQKWESAKSAPEYSNVEKLAVIFKIDPLSLYRPNKNTVEVPVEEYQDLLSLRRSLSRLMGAQDGSAVAARVTPIERAA